MDVYVKFECESRVPSLTKGKAYKLIDDEFVTNDYGNIVEIIPPNWDMPCAFLIGRGKWIYCKKTKPHKEA